MKPYKERELVLCPDMDALGLKVMEKLKEEISKNGFKYDQKFFNPLDFGRKLNLRPRELYKIKDFNDLRFYE